MFLRIAGAFVLCLALNPAKPAAAQQVTYGKKPQLPAPFSTKSAGNGPSSAKPAAGFLPTAPAGFHVNVYAKEFKYPRFLAVAPNGDIFLADTGSGEIVVMRDPQNTGGAQQREVFVSGMRRPFGIAFREDYVYIGNMNALLRFRYDPKTSKRLGEAEHLLDLPSGAFAHSRPCRGFLVETYSRTNYPFRTIGKAPLVPLLRTTDSFGNVRNVSSSTSISCSFSNYPSLLGC